MVAQAAISGILAFLILAIGVSVFPGASPASAITAVQVSLASPVSVAVDSDFKARINISEVADFDACNYDVSFDATVLRLDNIAGGIIGSTSIPVSRWEKVNPGLYRILQNVPGLSGVNGSGYLAELTFHVIGSGGTSSGINLSRGMLSSTQAQEIPATWVGGTVNVVSGSAGVFAPAPNPSPIPTVAPQPKSASIIDNKGFYTDNYVARSEDSKVQLTVGKGTRSLTGEKAPASIVISQGVGPPAPALPPPKYAAIVASTYDVGPDGTTFDPPIKITFAYDPSRLPPGAVEKELVIAWWDKIAGEWTKLEDSRADTASRTVTASVSHLTAFTVLANIIPPPKANFTIKDLAVSPSAVKAGERVNISLVVINSGNADGVYELTLKTDISKEVRTVAVSASSSQQVNFPVLADKAGVHTFDINGLTGSFTVEAPVAILKPTPAPVSEPVPAPVPAPPPTPVLSEPDTSISWIWLGGIIGGLAIVIALAILFVMRRQSD